MAGEEELGTGRTGGRDATTGVIPGRVALSVGCPDLEPPKGWKWTRLSSVAQLESGHTPSRKHPEYWDEGIPWIGIKDATENHGRTLSDTYQHVSALGLENSSARLLPTNTVCLSRTASVGFVVVMGRPMATSQDFVNWVCGPNIEPHYLKYVLLAENEALWRFASGTTHQTIYYPEAKAFHVCLPPLAEQKAIAAVLGALDDKIELNRRMNATLEAMARALFQSWFVDFDPVRAKLDGRKPVGMDSATVELFPASFQDSAVGHIPHGWKAGVLDELTKFVIGGDWGATEPTDDQTVSCFCIRGADIPSLQSGGVGKMPTRFLKPSSVEKRQLADGDLAIEISGGSPTQCTGRPVLASEALLQNLGQPLVASNFCRIVKLKSPALSKFVYLWLRRLYDARELFQFETGTTGIKNFAFVIFSERYPLVVPDLRVAEAFDRAVSPFFARIQANSQESRTLATLRDTLLPKLLSGEVHIPDQRTLAEVNE